MNAPATYRGSLLYAKEAKKRQQEHGGTAPGKPKNTGGNPATSDKGKARDHAAKRPARRRAIVKEAGARVTPGR